MTDIVLALGSNIGDSQAYIHQAIALLAEQMKNVRCASVYSSCAVGYKDQADFINTAVLGETSLSPRQLLKFVKEVEKKLGRIERFRWGPREIDIDIIFYGTSILDEEDLHIPHLRFAERDFVLRPLLELDAAYIDPRSGKTIQQLYDQLPQDILSVKNKI